MKSATAIFEALSSPVRRRILAYLSQTDLSAGQIAERFDLSKPTVSRHLSVLQNAGLITARRDAQFIIYHLNRDHLVSNMYDFLADFCPQSRLLKKESQESAKAKREKKGNKP
jgi:DNA-binding transcriptional ArsR family regulator